MDPPDQGGDEPAPMQMDDNQEDQADRPEDTAAADGADADDEQDEGEGEDDGDGDGEGEGEGEGEGDGEDNGEQGGGDSLDETLEEYKQKLPQYRQMYQELLEGKDLPVADLSEHLPESLHRLGLAVCHRPASPPGARKPQLTEQQKTTLVLKVEGSRETLGELAERLATELQTAAGPESPKNDKQDNNSNSIDLTNDNGCGNGGKGGSSKYGPRMEHSSVVNFLTDIIPTLATRKSYSVPLDGGKTASRKTSKSGAKSSGKSGGGKKASVNDDMSGDVLYVWELNTGLKEMLTDGARKALTAKRTLRGKVKQRITCLVTLIHAIEQGQVQKIKEEDEKLKKYDEEDTKRKEREQKRKEKEQKKEKKEGEKRAKETKKEEQEKAKKKSANLMTSWLAKQPAKKPPPAPLQPADDDLICVNGEGEGEREGAAGGAKAVGNVGDDGGVFRQYRGPVKRDRTRLIDARKKSLEEWVACCESKCRDELWAEHRPFLKKAQHSHKKKLIRKIRRRRFVRSEKPDKSKAANTVMSINSTHSKKEPLNPRMLSLRSGYNDESLPRLGWVRSCTTHFYFRQYRDHHYLINRKPKSCRFTNYRIEEPSLDYERDSDSEYAEEYEYEDIEDSEEEEQDEDDKDDNDGFICPDGDFLEGEVEDDEHLAISNSHALPPFGQKELDMSPELCMGRMAAHPDPAHDTAPNIEGLSEMEAAAMSELFYHARILPILPMTPALLTREKKKKKGKRAKGKATAKGKAKAKPKTTKQPKNNDKKKKQQKKLPNSGSATAPDDALDVDVDGDLDGDSDMAMGASDSASGTGGGRRAGGGGGGPEGEMPLKDDAAIKELIQFVHGKTCKKTGDDGLQGLVIQEFSHKYKELKSKKGSKALLDCLCGKDGLVSPWRVYQKWADKYPDLPLDDPPPLPNDHHRTASPSPRPQPKKKQNQNKRNKKQQKKKPPASPNHPKRPHESEPDGEAAGPKRRRVRGGGDSGDDVDVVADGGSGGEERGEGAEGEGQGETGAVDVEMEASG
ncbi:unnamed protein product [Vitrella brassicaformis CCMP3155]|uniref:Uncharacterized protein n=1 Tax=Vitrella brassicaformis (strain CCMP3155) TaxID=1169540 RepID=A0A0G4G1M2_VITBC|nr:unnamed protein product [Vitrella brassicaformis CCMP3155]|eukprot:CEM21776.1 unnamed protein product [Vitrella brassicaformis CCMP3155]